VVIDECQIIFNCRDFGRKDRNASEKLKNIKVGGLEYNYWNLEANIIRQCASSMKAFIAANHGDVGKLLEIIDGAKLSKKQEEMLAQLEIGE